MASTKNILWFREVSKEDIGLVGGKGANLGELTSARIIVPSGFIVTAQAYFEFLKNTGLDRNIKDLLKGLDPEKTKDLNIVAEKLQKAVLSKPISSKLISDIKKAYQELYINNASNIFVAVRSSATAEDLPTASFAGQQKTFLNVSGADDVVTAVRKCWASLFEPRAIYYRAVNKFDHLKVGIAVPVQKMVQSEKAGIMFTVDPISEDKDKIIIEAGFGLGEAVVSGSITPDRYVVAKSTTGGDLKILEKNVHHQDWQITKVGAVNKHVSLAKDQKEAQKLTDEEILEVAKVGMEIEEHYGAPQDTEWAFEHGKLYFTQSRPITTLKTGDRFQVTGDSIEINPKSQISNLKPDLEILLKGASASMGMASGPVKIIHKISEIDLVKSGDIMVTEMTTPDYVPAMKRAVGIVTDTGGQTSHAAIVSRELGIPCVVGTGTATHILKEGMIVTVDGAKGLIYKGKVARSGSPDTFNQPVDGPRTGSYSQDVPITATKVYVNLGEPSVAEKTAELPCDGVGLLRAEFIIAEIGEHPRALVKAGKSDFYVDKLSEGIRQICAAFYPRPVVYRATDFKTNEYKNLKGGAEFEPDENNPMIGYRGASRYVKEPDLFKLELEAIKRVRNKFDLNNLWMMIPFVRTVDQMAKVKEMIEDFGLEQSNDFKLWMMVEVPSNVILIDKFLDLGIDGVSIGSNDLTQLTLGVDRDNEHMADDFDERDEAVELSIAKVIKACRARHVTVSICGQAATTYPEIAELMVREGATSVSVSPDSVIATRRLIASVEKRLMLSNIIDR